MVTSMNIEGISGYCDPRFEEVAKIFSSAIKSSYETGASLAIEHQGEMVVNLWGGYQDEAKTKQLIPVGIDPLNGRVHLPF